jgi:hypothetical protein
VAWLADDARGGRGTGTQGLNAAAQYVADEFEAAGLLPAGDGDTWFQHFEATGGRMLIDGNELAIAGHALAVEQTWIPFSSVPACELSGALVFAGYGISDPDGEGYDDYAGLEAEGKLVLVMRGGPGGAIGHYNAGAGQAHSQFADKINTAYKHGALGILIVNDPANHAPGGEQDVLVSYHQAASKGVTASLPAAHVTGAALSSALAGQGFDLAGLQRRIEATGAPVRADLTGVVVELVIASEREQLATMNVVGVLPGGDPERSNEWVLIGAHMDHLGLGQGSSMGGAAAAGQIHNGADDNASGTAGVIEIAHALGRLLQPLPRTLVFVTFGAEEMGLLGSIWLNDHPPWPDGALVAMVNMDMIGRANDGHVAVSGLGTSDVFPGLLDDVLETLDGRALLADDGPGQASLLLRTSSGVTSNSDHHTFVESKVPVFSLFTGLHDDYHQPSDDVHLIDSDRGALIATIAGQFALVVAGLDARPAFTDPDAGRPAQTATARPPAGTTVLRGGVRFGSRPDYAYEKDDGVRIDGVGAGSPAEQCGLRSGDIIVALDGTAIRNIQDYMVLLYSHRAGDEMIVSVRRSDQQLELTAVLAPGQNAGR